jgi:IS30 family transposase
MGSTGSLRTCCDRSPSTRVRSGPTTIADHYGVDAWFCDPHSPWQRGQIENQNRTWRWWFPRGTDLAGLDPAQVNHVGDVINNQRRRHLGYHSPASLYAAASTVH